MDFSVQNWLWGDAKSKQAAQLSALVPAYRVDSAVPVTEKEWSQVKEKLIGAEKADVPYLQNSLKQMFRGRPDLLQKLVLPQAPFPEPLTVLLCQKPHPNQSTVGQAPAEDNRIWVDANLVKREEDSYDLSQVVVHEVAHKLDLGDGKMDGVPMDMSDSQRETYRDLVQQAFKQYGSVLQQHYAQPSDVPVDGKDPWYQRHDLGISNYAFLNQKEFLATTSETFFTDPIRLYHMPQVGKALFALYEDYYQVKPLEPQQKWLVDTFVKD